MRLLSVIPLFALGLIGLAGFTQIQTPPPGWSDVSTGRWQGQVEQAFEQQQPTRDPASQLYTALQVALFGQTQGAVRIGRDGWLFSQTEFRIDEAYGQQLSENLETIATLAAAAQDQGLPIEIVLVPDKARMLADRLPQPRAPILQARYGQILDTLRGHDLIVHDGLRSLAHVAQPFLRTDTHWTPEGAMAVAKGLASGAPMGTLTLVETREHRGDLYRLLDLGPYRSWLGYEYEAISVFAKVEQQADASALFGEGPRPIHLVGTSYSANAAFAFADAISAALDRPVHNHAAAGTGPIAPMQAYLAAQDGQPVPERVIWEIPEKYLALTPQDMNETQDKDAPNA